MNLSKAWDAKLEAASFFSKNLYNQCVLRRMQCYVAAEVMSVRLKK